MNRQRIILILLLLAGILCVATTYLRLSETDDELYHVQCGMEWWQYGTYTIQPLHPPLARVVDAALPYFFHLEDHTHQGVDDESMRTYYYKRLLLSRLGVLPFYVFSCFLVYRWSRQLFGVVSALWSLALYVSLSTVTATAGLATTDMVYMTMLLWALLSAVNWIEVPDIRRSILLGASVGLALASKFSTVVQWPVPMMVIILAQMMANYRQKRRLFPINFTHIKYGVLVAAPMAAYMIGLVFRFSFSALWLGLKDARELSGEGFSVWLYQPLHNTSVWYFFPVVFFFKTPLSFFITTIIGNAKIIRAGRDMEVKKLYPLLAALAIMGISMSSHINLGVRHVLPLYPLLAIPAGYGLNWLWQGRGVKRLVAGALLLWQVAGFINAYPEHIAYFNELAGDHPEHITLDSDYDWGQAMIMLNDAVEKRGIDKIHLCARKDAVWNALTVVKAKILVCAPQPMQGWVAVGRAFRLLNPDHFTWLGDAKAVQIIGRTMDLYYFPPQE